MTVRAALLQGQKLLEDAGISVPRLTAEVLLLHAISHDQKVDRAWLYAHSGDELREVWWIHYGRYLHERMRGKPTQYITGRQEFYGREFQVTPAVLIPRPETEHVIESALTHINAAIQAALASAHADNKSPAIIRVLDIGTGSGAIAVTLALETRSQVFATDISATALHVARDNARRLGANVMLCACDLGTALPDGAFDLVVSNPPYVPARDRASLQPEVREFEPEIALYGGGDGLAVYRRMIPEAARLLHSGGWLVMELGDTAADPVRELLGSWDVVALIADLAATPRVISARKR